MAKYMMICDVAQPEDIYLTGTGYLKCNPASLQIVEYSPTLADLEQAQIFELFGATLALFAVAFLFRQLFRFILNR